MEPEFWLERWHKQQIGFHLEQVNPLLIEFEKHCFEVAPIFVPLCGKSRDMLHFLRQGYRVLGVELAEKAVRDFFAEAALDFEEQQVDGLKRFATHHLVLYQADFFTLEAKHVADIHQIYDRAALIALPPEMRPRYVAHLLEIMPRPLSIMLITLSYPQQQMKGPPFSVTDEEVRRLFKSAHKIERLHYTSVLEQEDGFRRKGVSELYEAAYHIQI